VQFNITSVPSDGVSYYSAFSTASSATLTDVSAILPVGGVGSGLVSLSGTGLTTVKYYGANFSCNITPAPGTGSGWDFCLMRGITNCSNLGVSIYNGGTSSTDGVHLDTFTLIQQIAVKITPVNNPLPITKLSCGLEIRYAPLFLP
jgi:hypothetical protein